METVELLSYYFCLKNIFSQVVFPTSTVDFFFFFRCWNVLVVVMYTKLICSMSFQLYQCILLLLKCRMSYIVLLIQVGWNFKEIYILLALYENISLLFREVNFLFWRFMRIVFVGLTYEKLIVRNCDKLNEDFINSLISSYLHEKWLNSIHFKGNPYYLL